MENRILFGLLMLGEGDLARNYILFCLVASFGVLQFVAGRYGWRGMMLLSAHLSRQLGLALMALAYLWFFAIQPDLFIPGLAGGELLTFSLLAFMLAFLLALLAGFISIRLLQRPRVRRPPKREWVQVGKGRAEWWLPRGAPTIYVLALREIGTDTLDVLAGELVARSAAVLLCESRWSDAALAVFRERCAQFPETARAAVGLGTGGDRVLAGDMVQNPPLSLCARLALAPYGAAVNRHRGLHWLRETDYVSAWQATRGKWSASEAVSGNALIVYGDEDGLISVAEARARFPQAIFVAGARHFDLAAHPPVQRLACELFGLPVAVGVAAHVPCKERP